MSDRKRLTADEGMVMADTPIGTLKVAVDSQSYLLGNNLPVEIRDGGHDLVGTLRGTGELALPGGLYSVSAMLGDGRLHTQTTLVNPGKEARVEFLQADGPGAAKGRTRRLRGAAIEDDGAVLESVEGATIHSQDEGRWVFVPMPGITVVPVALFTRGEQTARVSLPVNPLDGFPRNSCVVEADVAGGRFALHTFLAPERRVASTIEGMLLSGEVLRGAEVMRKATAMLAEKYSDPVGAALGGLLLHRIGHLEARSDWVRNLAGSFKWLPDGRILRSALLAANEDADKRSEGLEMLLGAARQRVMFTDGFSLLLNLLRRWPYMEALDERKQLLEELSATTAGIDWRAIALTEYREAED